jgi:CMP-2-keto-3-deoxyoctulosonic acid synthetase
MRMGVAVVEEQARGGIDTPEDLDRANHEWIAFTTTES